MPSDLLLEFRGEPIPFVRHVPQLTEDLQRGLPVQTARLARGDDGHRTTQQFDFVGK